MKHVFIDESGTNKLTGFAVVAGVYIPKEHLSEIDGYILIAESMIQIGPFHWSHHKWTIRKKFLTMVLKRCKNLDIKVVITIKKYPFEINSFFEESLRIIVRENSLDQIIIDGQKSRSYERKIKKTLRESNISTRILSVLRDTSTPSLRLADGVAGLTRYYSNNPTFAEVRELFNHLKKVTHVTVYYI